jgi:hypothetical protein
MILYGLQDRSVSEMIEFFPWREIAEATLAEIPADEPEWRDLPEVLPVGFVVSPN